MIVQNFTTFRYVFSDRRLSAPDAGFTFSAGPPSTIQRGTGSFLTNGVATGMYCEPKNTANNDGKRGYISALTATLMTWDASGATLTAEGPTPGQQLRSFFVGVDALEEWPGPFSQTSDLVRSGGFDGGITGVPQPYALAAFHATVNGNAVDGVPGVDEYDWYLSQRTDTVAAQFLSIVPYTLAVAPATHSGTVTIQHTALATTELGLASPISDAQLRDLFRSTDIYVRRRSDGAIQWMSLDRHMRYAT
jgi:hypothetical protein